MTPQLLEPAVIDRGPASFGAVGAQDELSESQDELSESLAIRV